MRSIFAGMIMLSASVAVVDTARAQIHPERPPGDGPTQAPSGHQHPTRDELEKIDKDNRLLNLPASHDEITGAGQAPWGSMVKFWMSAQAAGAPRMRLIGGRGQSYNRFNHLPSKMS
jgi:hypothetical protein